MNTLTSAPIGTIIGGPTRMEKTSPDGYRLARKQSGELVLQGAYMWQQGLDYGHEWRDIPTVDLNVKVRGPEAALSPEAPSRLPGSAAGDNEAP